MSSEKSQKRPQGVPGRPKRAGADVTIFCTTCWGNGCRPTICGEQDQMNTRKRLHSESETQDKNKIDAGTQIAAHFSRLSKSVILRGGTTWRSQHDIGATVARISSRRRGEAKRLNRKGTKNAKEESPCYFVVKKWCRRIPCVPCI